MYGFGYHFKFAARVSHDERLAFLSRLFGEHKSIWQYNIRDNAVELTNFLPDHEQPILEALREAEAAGELTITKTIGV